MAIKNVQQEYIIRIMSMFFIIILLIVSMLLRYERGGERGAKG